jgi:hypothetical protein
LVKEPVKELAKEQTTEPSKETAKQPLEKTPSHSDEVGTPTNAQQVFCCFEKRSFIVTSSLFVLFIV